MLYTSGFGRCVRRRRFAIAPPGGADTIHGLSLGLLGRAEVTVGDQPITVDTRKAVALLAYLALEGPQRRDALAALLWPDSDRSHARGALRRTLSVTVRALDGRHLGFDNDVVMLATDDVDCDVWRFREHLATVVRHGDGGTCPSCLDALAAAAELHRGGFLEGLTLQDGMDFEAWQLLQDEHLRRELRTTLQRLVRGHSSAGSFDAAVTYAERLLGLDPLSEQTHRQLMTLHAWRGDRSEVVRQYRSCVGTLDAALGVAPLEETTRLYAQLIEGHAPPAPLAAPPVPGGPHAGPAGGSHAGATPSAARGSLPLVGRDAELRLLADNLEATGPDGRVVVVEGEPGIGRTRLVDELVGRGQHSGTTILRVRCHREERRLPYGVVAELLRVAMAGGTGGLDDVPAASVLEAARLVPELAPDRAPHTTSEPNGLTTGPPPGTMAASLQFYDGVCRVFASLATGSAGQALVVVDDAHLADRASVGVLTYLARRLTDRELCVVLTWSPTEASADHPLHRLASDPSTATVVRLRRLTPGEVRDLATVGLGPRGLDLTDRLYAETEGVPLLVAEQLVALAADLDDWSLAPAARARFLARVDPVRGAARQVLVAAAVIGHTFDVDELCRVTERDLEDIAAALDSLLARGLIVEHSGVEHQGIEHAAAAHRAAEQPGVERPGVERPGGAPPHYAFTHDKLRVVVSDSLGAAHRLLLQRRLDDARRAPDGGTPDQPAPAASHDRGHRARGDGSPLG